MTKRAKIWMIALAVAGLLAASITGIALAADPATTDDYEAKHWEQPGWGHFHRHRVIWSESMSELLGLTPEEIQAQRQEGKSLTEIAADQGVSEDELVAAILADRTEAIQQRVEDGYLTQEQADEMLEWMEQRIHEVVNRTDFGSYNDEAPCGYGAGGMGMGGGMMQGRHMQGHMGGYWSQDGGPGTDFGPGMMDRNYSSGRGPGYSRRGMMQGWGMSY